MYEYEYAMRVSKQLRRVCQSFSLEPLKPGSVPQKKRATAAATLEEQKCKQCASCNNWERKDLDVGTWWTDGNKRGRSQKLSPVGQANNGTTALDRPVGKQNFQMF